MDTTVSEQTELKPNLLFSNVVGSHYLYLDDLKIATAFFKFVPLDAGKISHCMCIKRVLIFFFSIFWSSENIGFWQKQNTA